MELVPQERNNNGMMEVAISRQAQEVQAAMVIAQRFPRDITRAVTRVMEDCKRKGLAEKAVYSYPRGKGDQKTVVTGPSIRLAEAIAKAYGNLDFGVIELERKNPIGDIAGESTMLAYCWDLETNTRSQKVFTVTHKRNTRNGSYNITDERDIYEMSANNAARRLRAAILSIIPTDIVEKALVQCNLTIKSSTEPLTDRIQKMVLAFKNLGVSQQMIEGYLEHKIDITTEDEIVELVSVFNSIKDGQASREDFFTLTANSVNNETQAQQPATPEAKSFATKPKVKNFAPQTAEEAKSYKSPEVKNSDSKSSEPIQKNQDQERVEKMKKLMEIAKVHGNDLIYTHSPKLDLRELTLDEMDEMISRITKQLGKGG